MQMQILSIKAFTEAENLLNTCKFKFQTETENYKKAKAIIENAKKLIYNTITFDDSNYIMAFAILPEAIELLNKIA